MADLKMKVASIDIDAQKGFTPLCPSELPVPDGDKIVTALNEMAKRADYRLGSKDAHCPQAVWIVDKASDMLQPISYVNADRTWLAHCISGTKGFELLEGLPKPEQYDFFVWKGIEPEMHPYGACYHDLQEKLSTGLIEYLQFKKIEQVILGGLALDYCVKITAIQLVKAGFRVLVLLEASKALSKETGEQAILQMKQLGIVVCNDLVMLDKELNRQ